MGCVPRSWQSINLEALQIRVDDDDYWISKKVGSLLPFIRECTPGITSEARTNSCQELQHPPLVSQQLVLGRCESQVCWFWWTALGTTFRLGIWVLQVR